MLGQEAHFHDEILLRSVSLLAQNPQKFFTAGSFRICVGICARTLNRRFQLQYGKPSINTRWKKNAYGPAVPPGLSWGQKLQTVAVNFGFCDEFHLI